MLIVHVHVHLRPFSTTFHVFCKPCPMFSSCILSSHLCIFSPTQGHTTDGADLISWEIQVVRKDGVWATSYVWSDCITSHFTHRLDTQMKYILHMILYQEMTSSLNSSKSKKWFTPWTTSFISTQSLREGLVSLESIGLVWNMVLMQWQSITLGKSLEDLFVQCCFKFMIKTVLLLARQLVSEFDF